MRALSLAVVSIFATFAVVFVVMIPIVASYTPSWRLALVALIAIAFTAAAIVIYWLVEIRDVLTRCP